MNPEEIKVGETYNVRVKVDSRSASGNFICASVTPNGRALEPYVFLPHEAEAFSHITPVNGIKNTETTPKYDPCRKFREGDIVTPCSVKGRWQSPAWKERSGIHFIVTDDEDEDFFVKVKDPDSLFELDVTAVYLNLVVPVEEREPYVVRHNEAHAAWSIYGPYNLSAVNYFYGERYPYTEATAKEAAEAECARLNAEWRKEVEK